LPRESEINYYYGCAQSKIKRRMQFINMCSCEVVLFFVFLIVKTTVSIFNPYI